MIVYYKDYEYHNPKVLGRKNNKIDNNIYTFDIETTSYLRLNGKIYRASEYENFNKHDRENIECYSIMYIWMFSINDTVYYGRTWEELKEFLFELNNNIPVKKIVFIHNLSYEFQFLRSVFNFDLVFARTKRKVMNACMNFIVLIL